MVSLQNSNHTKEARLQDGQRGMSTIRENGSSCFQKRHTSMLPRDLPTSQWLCSITWPWKKAHNLSDHFNNTPRRH